MKKSTKNCLSFIVSLITMFAICIASASLFLDNVILNEQVYTKILQEKNISSQVESDIYDNLNYLLISNNIPAGTLDGIISKEEIEENLYNYVYYTVEFMKYRTGKMNTIDTTIYEKRIDKKIDEFINKNKENINSDFYDNLGDFKKEAVNIIDSNLQIINLDALSKSSTIKLISKLSSIVSSIKFLSCIILLIILLSSIHILIWLKRKSRIYAWISYPFIAWGTILFLIGFSGYLSKFYENIAINEGYLKILSISIMQNYVVDITFLGIIILFLGLLCISVYWRHLFRALKTK